MFALDEHMLALGFLIPPICLLLFYRFYVADPLRLFPSIHPLARLSLDCHNSYTHPSIHPSIHPSPPPFRSPRHPLLFLASLLFSSLLSSSSTMQRTTALSAWVSLALAYGAAQVAAQATLNTPGSLIECVPAAITWNGATGNVYLSAYDANNNRLAQYPTQTGASGTYSIGPVTFPVGADVHFVINDDTGVQNATGGVTVAAGTSDSCKNSSSSSSGSSSTGAAAGAGSSSSRSSSSSSSASRTSSSSSSSSTARSSSSSSSEPASSTSSSAAPTTSSSSSTAAPSSSTASVVSSAPSSTTQSDGAVSIDASAMRSFGVAALVGLAGLGFGAFAL